MAYIDWALDLVSDVEDGGLLYCKLESFLVQSSVGLILASQATFGNTSSKHFCGVQWMVTVLTVRMKYAHRGC